MWRNRNENGTRDACTHSSVCQRKRIHSSGYHERFSRQSERSRDIFQDYDIVYVVTSLQSFVNDRSWIDRFGKLIIMQTPDEMGVEASVPLHKYAFLMQFTDGNRIDLTFYESNHISSWHRESLSVLLLDKDGIIAPFDEPSNRDYLTILPTAAQFAECCNEFWWVSTYVAKGLWRRELAYAKFMYERPVRDMLIRMLQWHIGIQTKFAVDSGKCGKYFERYLTPGQWVAFVQTYPDGDYEHMWQGLLSWASFSGKQQRK